MDQDSFRNFVASSSSSSAPKSAAAGVLGGATPRRGYQPPPKKDLLKKPAEAVSKDVFKSKKQKKLEGKYMDRAAQRRAGLEDEYSEVIQVREEFERRLAEEAEDAAEMEEKRKYLGGDAEHSILVKGLDYALLAKNRAELDGTDGADEDDELEAAYLGGSSATRPPADEDSAPAESKKRTREEILAAVEGKKRARSSGSRAEPEPVAEKLSNSKFKPIGFKESKSSKASKEGAAGGEKKLKKKKKKIAPVEEDAPGSMGPPSLPSMSTSTGAEQSPAVKEESRPELLSTSISQVASSSHSTAPPLPTPTTAPVPKAKAMAKPLIAAPIDDDDDDIFGGVGDYEGPDDSDSNSDGDGDKPTSSSRPPLSTGDSTDGAPAIKRTNWFSATGSVSPSPSPPKTIIPLPAKQARASGSRSPSRSRSPSPSAPNSMGRLVPLSGSSMPSVAELLRRDAVNTELAIKKEKKRVWRIKQGLPPQADDDDDEGEKIEIDWDAENNKGKKEWKGKGKGKGGKSKEEEDEIRAQRDLREYEKYEKKKAGAK